MTDIMLDLETWGTRPGCAIRSIGACAFDPAGHGIGAAFYVNVNQASCEAEGLTVDPGTVAWWSRQSQEAQQALLVDRKPLYDALWTFASWWQTTGGERVWSHGANFDQPILEACFHAAGFPGAPWSFWNSRCTRTIYDLAGVDTRKANAMMKHHALDDARVQALAVQAALRRIRGLPEPAPSGSVFE